jgi:MATE family multidrug resistance protein
MSLAFAAVAILAFLTMAEPLFSLFMQDDDPQRPAILAIGVGLLAAAALFQLLDGAQAIALGLLRGAQDTRVPMLLAAFSYWIVGIPASYLLGFVLKYEGFGVWLGLVLGLGVAALLLSWRFWAVTLHGLRLQYPAGAMPRA